MNLTDLAIQNVEQECALIYHLEWFENITEGLSYPKMGRFCDAFSQTKHLLLFFKLVQMDIFRSQPQEEHRTMMVILENYILKALHDRGLSADVWDGISEMDITDFARKWDVAIPATGIDTTATLVHDRIVVSKVPERMPALLSADDSMALYTFLRDNNFISLDTSPASFHYRMGVVGAATDDQRPVKWQKNKQLLREMLEMCFASLVENGSVKKSDIERRVPKCFINRMGLSISLSKNKVEESWDRDLLLAFFKVDGAVG